MGGEGESLFPLHFSLREFGLRHFLPSSSLYTRYSVYRDTQYLYTSIYMCTLYCMYTVWIPIFLHLKYCIMLVNNWHSCLMNVIHVRLHVSNQYCPVYTVHCAPQHNWGGVGSAILRRLRLLLKCCITRRTSLNSSQIIFLREHEKIFNWFSWICSSP